MMCRVFTNGKKEEKGIEDFREKIIKEMEKKLGDVYRIFPKDVTKNNHLSLHGIFIHKMDESIAAVVYPDEYFIYPASLDELLILPVRGRNRDCMDTEDIQQINMSSVPREKCLSNSIYLYDRAKQKVSIYKEGAPL